MKTQNLQYYEIADVTFINLFIMLGQTNYLSPLKKVSLI